MVARSIRYWLNRTRTQKEALGLTSFEYECEYRVAEYERSKQ